MAYIYRVYECSIKNVTITVVELLELITGKTLSAKLQQAACA